MREFSITYWSSEKIVFDFAINLDSKMKTPNIKKILFNIFNVNDFNSIPDNDFGEMVISDLLMLRSNLIEYFTNKKISDYNVQLVGFSYNC